MLTGVLSGRESSLVVSKDVLVTLRRMAIKLWSELSDRDDRRTVSSKILSTVRET